MNAKELIRLLGPEAARTLCEAMGGARESIPTLSALDTAETHLRIWQARDAGATVRDLMRDYPRYSEQNIRVILKSRRN